MPEETAISLKNRTDRNVAPVLNMAHLITRPPIQRKPCWKAKQNTEFIDTVVHGWHCTPIYLIVRENGEDDDDYDACNCGLVHHEVFDGAHKVEAIVKFINDGFTLEKLPEASPISIYAGKKFSDLPVKIRDKIKNYVFTTNIIDPETANDKDSLSILWARLNKAGKPLNDFELALPVISELVNTVLKPSLPYFLNSAICTKEASERGEVEKLLQIIIATSESPLTEKHLSDFTHKKNLIKLWQEKFLGTKINEIKETVAQKKDVWLMLLKKASQYMASLLENGVSTDSDGNDILQSAHRGTELIFLLGRSIYHFPKLEEFRRICPELSIFMKKKYITQVLRDPAGRNGIFQKRILNEIDVDVMAFLTMKAPRSFTSEQIKKKFIEQNGICALCTLPITKTQKYHADHILPWSMGGNSDDGNCQVSHAKCNLAKQNREGFTVNTLI